MLGSIRPPRLFLATFVVPAVVLPIVGAVWMRATNSFLLMSKPVAIEDPWVWPITGLVALTLYAFPAGVVFLAARRASPRLRNLLTVSVLAVYLFSLGIFVARRV
jgi:hypothetical protein